MVTVQVAYRFRTPAFSSSVFCASVVSSLLSSSKNTGLSGEFLFRSSSDADEIASSRTGSGGTMVGSGDRLTAARAAAAPCDEGSAAEVAGRATGGLFLWHAAAVITASANDPPLPSVSSSAPTQTA